MRDANWYPAWAVRFRAEELAVVLDLLRSALDNADDVAPALARAADRVTTAMEKMTDKWPDWAEITEGKDDTSSTIYTALGDEETGFVVLAYDGPGTGADNA